MIECIYIYLVYIEHIFSKDVHKHLKAWAGVPERSVVMMKDSVKCLDVGPPDQTYYLRFSLPSTDLQSVLLLSFLSVVPSCVSLRLLI